jgi:hypothetical protein
MARRLFDQESNRLFYGEQLMPEPGYSLDFAVGMTYSLDLNAFLGIPISLGMLDDLESAGAQRTRFTYWRQSVRAAIVSPFSATPAVSILLRNRSLSIFCLSKAYFRLLWVRRRISTRRFGSFGIGIPTAIRIFELSS